MDFSIIWGCLAMSICHKLVLIFFVVRGFGLKSMYLNGIAKAEIVKMTLIKYIAKVCIIFISELD